MVNRLRQVRKELQLTQESLAQYLGIGKSALSMIETGRAGLSERNKNILVQNLNVNPEWLDKGIGQMFNVFNDGAQGLKSKDKSSSVQNIPLYNIDMSMGLERLFSSSKKIVPMDYIYIPNLPKCDGAIYVVGDGMYPNLKSGDIVLYKQIHSVEGIFWGEIYLMSIDMDGEEYITIKYIQKSETEGFIKLISQNPLCADKDVAVSQVRALALVKASIRMNSLR